MHPPVGRLDIFMSGRTAFPFKDSKGPVGLHPFLEHPLQNWYLDVRVVVDLDEPGAQALQDVGDAQLGLPRRRHLSVRPRESGGTKWYASAPGSMWPGALSP